MTQAPPSPCPEHLRADAGAVERDEPAPEIVEGPVVDAVLPEVTAVPVRQDPDPDPATTGASGRARRFGRRGDGARPGRPAAPSGPRPRAALVALLGSMSAIFAVTVDMYLPSLPQVASEMQVNEATAQLTISFMMIGAAFGQLVVGPWSDRVGRRKPVIIGASLHVVACLLVLLGSGIGVFLGLRLLQGVAAASLGVCAQAFIRDRYTGAVAAATISRMMLVIGVAPLFAPTVGGFIAQHWGWRAVFGVLAGCGALVLLACWRFLPESHPVEKRMTGGIPAALRNYRVLLADRRFLALAVLPGLVSGALMAYVSGSPFVLQDQLGLSAHQFSLFFAVGGVLLVGMAQVNAALVHRYSSIRIIRLVLPLQLGVALVLLGVSLTGVGPSNALLFLVPLAAVLSFQNFVPPNATTIALSRHGERAGSAAAVLGCLGALLPALISPLVGVLGGSAIAMAAVMVASILAALIVAALGTSAYRRGGWETGRD
ncbi:multidrug effflux MFS transporter [Miniimonas arenae]|uniref:Multidrug effflux MFS transporter n=1 Tax=Miniimonas arenae TaxID=676201 RepID=A0A5C5BC81_9MICO|nr:multidrug effflux MFS transporter [Miniimonas arenae]TNU73575.1 multidrug effflux MFS transporter [Miniimonas arenae]